MITFREYLTEAISTLVPSELKRDNSSNQEPRINILRDQLLRGKKLKVIINKRERMVEVDADKKEITDKIDQFKRDGLPIPFVSKDGIPFTSSNIVKTKVFGGWTKKMGTGSKPTRLAEAAHALWCQAVIDNGLNTIDYFTDEILSSAFRRTSLGKTKLEPLLAISDDWKYSSYQTAITLMKEGIIKRGMIMHHQDLLVRTIYSRKKIAYKKSKLSDINDDKWNPADIWASESGFKPTAISIDNVKSLNNSIMELYHNKILIGISLKKVENKAKLKEFNIEIPPDTDDFNIVSIAPEGKTNRSSFWSGKYGLIYLDDGTQLKFRDDRPMDMIKVEIDTPKSRGGSMVRGVLIDTVQSVLGKKLVSNSEVKSTISDIIAGNNIAIEKFYGYYKEFYSDLTLDQFKLELLKMKPDWISSKFQVLEIFSLLKKNTGSKANRVITKIVNHASSNTEDSSTFIKVFNK